MPQIDVPLVQGRFGATSRPDAWWVQPLVVFLGFTGFHRVFHMGRFSGRSLPLRTLSFALVFAGTVRLARRPGSARKPAWFPAFLRFSAAFLILWAPGGFRFTCYYYRGAYYKAFWADPPNCTVGEPRKTYRGERTFPLIIQNIHRYFLYIRADSDRAAGA